MWNKRQQRATIKSTDSLIGHGVRSRVKYIAIRT